MYEDGSRITYEYDSVGNIVSVDSVGPTVVLAPGDLDGDGELTLSDAILGLQICAGMNTQGNEKSEADTNEDGRIGMEDISYVFRCIAVAGNAKQVKQSKNSLPLFRKLAIDHVHKIGYI